MDSNLPKGWIEISFTELLDVQGGTQPPKSTFIYVPKKDYIRLLQIRDFGEKPHPTFIPFRTQLKTCTKEDILIARYGASLGRIVTGMEGAYNVALAKVVIPEEINKKFVYHLLRSEIFQRPILANERSAQDGFNKDDLERIQIPLPPLPEQQRIVEKLDALMTRINNSKERLEKIPTLLKNFRQSVLADAVNGELTKEWREENDNITEAKTKTNKKERKNILDDKVDDYELFELPAKWNWKTISDISDVKGGKRIPKGHQLVSYDTGLPYIKAGDLKKGTVIKDKLEFLLPETQKIIKRYIVSKGDVYITNVGAKIGDAGVIPDDMDGANLTENALKMCNLDGVINLYLSIWLQSPIAQRFIQKTILSAAQGKLALGRVEVFPIPLPPIQEQNEIVRKVEELFHFADSIEARYQKAKAWFDKLPQAILAKAFRGELVPQDESDEPASELLKRIQQEKHTISKQPKTIALKAKRRKSYKIDEDEELRMVAEG
ncbi:type I restriction enzyme S subunit [Lacibacter cauensis]|uniref:Type I restriction enzyme S subunit n=1 Tax=Lacibacter cauensis TaxID=510947 RepID=A0A562SQ59_9BACT|nr:restriction endonuclease subunit S [Lacibacter cauensis]TWI83273.1 type I restriction enzyme S subunit [Lacibacter cauensis]